MPRRAVTVAALGALCIAACAPIAAGEPSGSPAAEAIVVTTAPGERRFEPASVTSRGPAVRVLYRNQSGEAHNLTFLEPLAAATVTILEPGREQLLEFAAPGEGRYRFVCTIHPGMEGTLAVE